MSGNEKIERELESFLSEDDSRLAVLYRKLPRPEPDAKLDAAVLAMAQRTVVPPTRASRPRWLPALGAAAGIVLAAGVALRIGPQIWHARTGAPAPVHDEGMIEVRPLNAPLPPPSPASPAPASESTAAPPAPATAPPIQMQAVRAAKPKSAPTPREEAPAAAPQAAATSAPAIAADHADVDAKELKKVENAAPPPASPMAFPEQVPRQRETDSVERKQAAAESQTTHVNEALDAASAPAAAGTAAPAAAKRAKSEVAEIPERWIERIRAQLRERHRETALRDLAQFRQRYPDYRLPDDLRDLK